MNKQETIPAWIKGWKDGVDSVFNFLSEMEKVKDAEELKKEYLFWENADEYKKPNGEVVER